MARPRGQMFYIGVYRENEKKSSCLKPKGLEPWHLVCSIAKWTSTKFVQIISFWPEMPWERGGGSNVLHRLI